MFRKLAIGMSALALGATLVSCSSSDSGEELAKVDVNGLTIADACEKVRESGWIVSEVTGKENFEETSDCSDSERKVVSSNFWNGEVDLHFANDPLPSSEEAPAEEAPAEEAPAEEPEVEEETIEEASVDSGSGYQAIYDEYSARLENECPNLAMTECAELSNEGVSKMAQYMYTAKGKDGQYETYQEWSQKLYDVYLASVM